MRITQTYGWAASPSFSNYTALLEEFKLLLMDSTLTDIPTGLKNIYYYNGAFYYSYGIRGYRLIRKAILECLDISEDDPDISQYCDVQYPSAIYTSPNSSYYKYSCVVTRIVDAKADDATNRVYYLIGNLRYYRNTTSSTSGSNNENYILENVILCESLGTAENERNLSLSQWGKPFADTSVGNYHWNYNLPIKESKIVSQSLARYYTDSTSNTNSGYYLCNTAISTANNMALYGIYDSSAYSNIFPAAMFNTSGSSFKVQGHVDDNGTLSLIYTIYNNVLCIKKVRFPDSMLADIHSYTCIADVYNGRFCIYVKGSYLGGIDGNNDRAFSAYRRWLLPTMNTLDTLLAGPGVLYSGSSSSQMSEAFAFGIVQTPYYITNEAYTTHNFQAGQLLQGNTYIYCSTGNLILPWDSSVLWMSLSS